MEWWIIWLPLAAASLALIVVLVSLATKSGKLLRQTNRLEKQVASVNLTRKPESISQNIGVLPDLKDALKARSILRDSQSKKREDKQRRLIKRLRDLES